MKTAVYALIAAFLILAITPATTAERYGWSGYLGKHASGMEQLPSGKYELPSWVHQDAEPCVVAARDYNNDGKYDRYIWGVEWTNPFTHKTICYVPARGGRSNNAKHSSSGGSVSPPPPPPPPPNDDDDDETDDGGDDETCETVETCENQEVCAPPVCHDERSCAEYSYSSRWVKNHCEGEHNGNSCACRSHNHQNCHLEESRTCEDWVVENVCAAPVCHEEEVCSSREVCSS